MPMEHNAWCKVVEPGDIQYPKCTEVTTDLLQQFCIICPKKFLYCPTFHEVYGKYPGKQDTYTCEFVVKECAKDKFPGMRIFDLE